jgi:hypothetical protein
MEWTTKRNKEKPTSTPKSNPPPYTLYILTEFHKPLVLNILTDPVLQACRALLCRRRKVRGEVCKRRILLLFALVNYIIPAFKYGVLLCGPLLRYRYGGGLG